MKLKKTSAVLAGLASVTLFAYTNYRKIQGSHRIEPLDFKGKGAFPCTIGVEYVFRGTTEPCGELYFASTLVVVKLRNAPCDSHPRERSKATIDWQVANR